MPLDPRIALGFQAPQFESPMNMMAKLSEMSANANQSKLAQTKLAREMEEAAALKGVNALAATPGFDIRNPATLQQLNSSVPGRQFVADYYTGATNRANFGKADEELVKAEMEGRRATLLALGDPKAPNAAQRFAAWRQGTRTNRHLQDWMDSHGMTQPSDEEFNASIATPEGLANEWNNAIAALNQLTGKGEVKPQQISTGEDLGEIVYDENPNSPTFGQRLAAFKSKPPSGGNTFNMGDRTDLEAVKLGTKALYDTREKLTNAPEYWQSLEKARALIPTQKNAKGEPGKAFMGTGAEPVLEAIKFFNNRFGTNINPKGVTDADELRSLMFDGVLENLRKLDSQPAQSQQFALSQSLGNIGSDPNALVNIIDWTQQKLEERVNRYNNEATQASTRIKFLYDMPIKMPTRQATPNKTPKAPDGYVVVPKK